MFKGLILIVPIALTIVLAPAITQAANSDKPLKKNHWHENVHTVQQNLDKLGLYNYHTSTGFFGNITYEGVKEFQKLYGLTPSGTVNAKTGNALEEATTTLERGDRGEAVKHLQKNLTELELYDANIDGKFGPLTEQAIINYQKDKNLEVNGKAGFETRAALLQSKETTTQPKDNATTEPKEEKKTITMESTAYTANCDGCSGVTATGINLNANPDQKVIAVDPDVIPLGTEVYVEGYGRAIAGDTGGAIDGNRIDVYVQSNDKATDWGRKKVEVTILG